MKQGRRKQNRLRWRSKREHSLPLTDIFDNESLYHRSWGFCRYFELLSSKMQHCRAESTHAVNNIEEWYQVYSRRNFLKTSATAAAASLLPSSALLASIAPLGGGVDPSDNIGHARRLSDGWEFLQGSLGGPWEAWHSEEVAVWQPVAMPHCFNAYDGCDPDVPYYRGNGWYRTHVPIANPFPKGRTLLHFEGSGQTTAVDVREKLAGKHTGGYDEVVFDITDLLIPDLLPEPAQGATPPAETATSAAKNKKKKPDGVPISMLCDNSRDLDRMPSDLSDFSLYGGIYRHVNLVYVPAVSLETMHVRTDLPSPTGPAKIAIVRTLYNPASATNSFEVSVDITDSKGTSIHPP